MRIKKILLSSLLICIFINTTVLADPLLLSDAEMQKLEKYFPSQDDNANLVWNGSPLSITLPINQEKRIIFPEKILPDLKNALTTDQLRVINDNKSLYLTALKPFSVTRLYVTLQNSGEVVLIDLSTNNNANNATTTIIANNIKPQNNHSSIVSEPIIDNFLSDASGNSTLSDNDNYVTLIRFAWQQFYAPKRLLNNQFAITRVPMHTLPMLSTLIYGDKVYAHPEASWIYNGTYVTAIELRNKYPHATTIYLNRDICGNWQAASLYPKASLKAAGNKGGDSAVLFLVSKQPFGETMEVCNGSA